MDSSATLLNRADAVARAELADEDTCSSRPGEDFEAPAKATLSVVAVGLSLDDEQALNALFFSDQPTSPRLLPVEEARFAAADVVLIDARNRQARHWWRQHRNALVNRPVVWMGQRSPYEAHTTLVLPVVWSLLPLILYRAAQSAPERRSLAERVIGRQDRDVLLIAPRRVAGAQLRWMLETLNCRVTVTRSAREGLAALHAAPYAGVILARSAQDECLDVADFCGRIRRLERRLGRLPVLVLNQEVSAWQRLRALLLGDVEFSSWPRHPAQLKAVLASWGRGTSAVHPQTPSH
jgi:CheY-like chemotaxis protein